MARKGSHTAVWLAPAPDNSNQGEWMNGYQRKGQLALMVVTMAYALAAHASAGQNADTRVPDEQRVSRVGSAVVGHPNGWPEAVVLPEGVEIDGYRCSNRYCTLWFGLMDFDHVMALKRSYIKLLKDSGKWEQLGSPGDPYENEAFHYTGTMPSGCGYTLEIRQGIIPNDYYRRYRVSTSLTW